jgi:hypothetical protein
MVDQQHQQQAQQYHVYQGQYNPGTQQTQYYPNNIPSLNNQQQQQNPQIVGCDPNKDDKINLAKQKVYP